MNTTFQQPRRPVWLYREGKYVVVAIEENGQWREIIRELHDTDVFPHLGGSNDSLWHGGFTMIAYAYPRPVFATIPAKRGWKNWGDVFEYYRFNGHDPSSAAEKADAWEKRQIRKIRKGKHLHEKQP